MSEVFTASGSINIDVNKAIDAFNKVDKKAQETTKTLDNTSNKSKSWSDKFSSLGNKLSLGVTAPLMAAGIASFKAASDFNESLSKTETVFGNNARAIIDWSKTSTTAFGASQSEALEMVSKYGAMGSAMGLTSEQTKNYSINLTQLAGDMASMNNISIERANDALTGVYTGETEALKSQGIIMTQINLQHYAESKGIHKKIQDMTQAELVQLRYNFVMDNTNKMHGDYMRTSQGAANTSKTLFKNIENLKVGFGQFLIGLTPLIGTISNMIVAFNGLSDGTKQIIIYITAFAMALGPLIKGITTLNKGVLGTIKFFKAFPGGIKKGIDGFKKFTKATRTGTNIIGRFGKGLIKSTRSIGKFELSLGKSTLGLIKNSAMWVSNTTKMVLHKTATLAVTGATKAMTLAQKALNLAMRMNPIGLVITILLALGAVFVTLYNKCEWFRNGVNAVWSFITNLFKKFSDFLTGVFTTDWTKSFGVFGNIINAFMHNMSNIFGAIKRIFGGLIDFITGVFTGNWSQAWQGVVNIFGGIMDGLGAVIKAPLNAVIGLINGAIGGINSLSVDIPSWVPVFGGQHFGVNLPTLNYLYTGAVFDQPTLLGGGNIVGDKFKGTGSQREYVLPEPMIRKVVSEVIREEIGNLKIIMDGREVARCIAAHKDTMDKMYHQLNPF